LLSLYSISHPYMKRFLKLSDSGGPKTPPKRRPEQPSKLVDCPLCGRAFLSAVVELHAGECQDHLTQPATPKEENQNSSHTEEEKHSSCDSQCEADRTIPGKSAGRTGAPNALNVLMTAAAVVPRVEYFTCNMKGVVTCETLAERTETSAIEPRWEGQIEVFKNVHWQESQRKGSRVVLQSAAPSAESLEAFYTACAQAACSSPWFRRSLAPHAEQWSRGRTATKLSVGVLKSLLQKSIRRNMSCAAVFLTIEMLVKSRHDLFRRLPVIVLEDSFLHQDFAYLVWIMAACAKGFIPSTPHIRRLLMIVHQVAAVPYLDSVNSTNLEGEQAFDFESLDCSIQQNTHRASTTLIRAMMYRADFGGMGGDIRMIIRHAGFWSRRLRSNADAWLELLAKIHQDGGRLACQTEAPERVTIPIAGVDFHCCPWMLDQIESEADTGVVKRAMWECHSSINHRKALPASKLEAVGITLPPEESAKRNDETSDDSRASNLIDVWQPIQDSVESICSTFLRSRCPGIDLDVSGA